MALFTQAALREMDLLARLEDGEFAVLMPGSTAVEASQVAKRLQVSAAGCMFPLDGSKSQLNITQGIAELRPNETAEILLARAKSAARLGLQCELVNG